VASVAVLVPWALRVDRAAGLGFPTILVDLAVGGLFACLAVVQREPLRIWPWGAVAVAWLAGSVWPELVGLHRPAFVALVAVIARPWVRVGLPGLLMILVAASVLALPTVGPGVTAVLLAGIALVLAAGGDPLQRVAVGALLLLAGAEALLSIALRGDLTAPELLSVLYSLAFLTSAVWVWVAARSRERALVDLAPSSGAWPSQDAFQMLTQLVGSTLRDPSAQVEPARGQNPPMEGRAVVVDGAPWAQVTSTATWLADDTVWRPLHMAIARVGEGERLLAEERRHVADLAASRVRLVTAADRERSEIGARLRSEVLAPLESALVLLGAEFPVIGVELRGAVADVESLVAGVSPVPLGQGALVPAVSELAKRCPLPVDLGVSGDVASTTTIETALYAVCAEAVTNALKHARASRIGVRLEADRGAVRLTVTDDGVGVDAVPGSGLAGLADRVSAVGGQLRVARRDAGGTSVVVDVPSLPAVNGTARS